MTDFSIELATPDDLAWFVENNHFDLKPDAIRKKIDDGEVYVGRLKGTPVAALLIEYIWTRKPLVSFIWVQENARRGGYGRKLMEFAEARFRAEGWPYVLSSTQVDNLDSHKWHTSMGYRECGIIAAMNPGNIGEVFFRKEL